MSCAPTSNYCEYGISIEKKIQLFIYIVYNLLQDWKNIESIALTDRIKLWSKFNPKVDQDTVKSQFIRRVMSDRLKNNLISRHQPTAAIPHMVKYHYRNPNPLLMSLKNVHRVRAITSQTNPLSKDAQTSNYLDEWTTGFDCEIEGVQPNKRDIQVRAVLTPIAGNPLEEIPPRPLLHLSTEMRYRKLTVGTASSNDVRLDGECMHQSDKHATIFFDDYTKSFELLNYSDHGTEVNGQLYSLNLKAKTDTLKNGRCNKLGEMVAEIIDKKRNLKRIKYGHISDGGL